VCRYGSSGWTAARIGSGDLGDSLRIWPLRRALHLAELLHRMGYLETAKVVHAMRDDQVGEYIGQTAPKTRWVLEHAMGGRTRFIHHAAVLVL
jgi:hypothetical protein